MENEQAPYIPQTPGDLITAEAWNRLQTLIRDDIGSRIEEAVSAIDNVPNAGNSEKLSEQTAKELSDEIVKRALAAIPERTGYLKLFKRLKLGEDSVIEHGLKACPLVDAYQLDHFPAVCAVHDEKTVQLVTFYLYHSSERKIRCKSGEGDGAVTVTVEIEPTDGRPYRISFAELLDTYDVDFTSESSLGDLQAEFWQAFFSDPNDRFDHDQFCHSPWFERCCREERTVKSLKSRGDWDELWIKIVPRKTINFELAGRPQEIPPSPAPTQIQVCQYDRNTIGVRLLSPAVPQNPTHLAVDLNEQWTDLAGRMAQELKVMLLLKV